MVLLDIRNVNIVYKMEGQDILACDDVNITMETQDSLGIVGESGSGKSTLAMGILGLLPANITSIDGEIIFKDTNLIGLSREDYAKLRWKELSAVFQKSMNSLSPVHKVGKQMAAIYRVHMPSASDSECRKMGYNLFEKVGLSSRVYDAYPHELSGGMAQRVAIALSLMFHPALVILDEATTALDVITEGQILRELVTLQEKEKMASIVITHNVSVVATTCKKVVVMYAGRIVESGWTDQVLVTPKHPYTQGLLKSFPAFHGERQSLRGIPGSLPDLSMRIPGCVFAPRCPHAVDRCHKERPSDILLGEHWRVACFLVEGDEKQ